MVKINKRTVLEDGTYDVQASGLHDDTKPTNNIATGSLFLEVDTGDVYAFDEEGGEWDKICALGGAGT